MGGRERTRLWIGRINEVWATARARFDDIFIKAVVFMEFGQSRFLLWIDFGDGGADEELLRGMGVIV